MRVVALVLALAAALGPPALAGAPETSPRPEPRPVATPLQFSTANALAGAPGALSNLVAELEAQPDLSSPPLAVAAIVPLPPDVAAEPVAAAEAASRRPDPTNVVAELAQHPSLIPEQIEDARAVRPAALPAGVRASLAGVVSPAQPAVRPPGAVAVPALMAPPPARPASLVRQRNPARQVEVVQAASAFALNRSPRPSPRPDNLRRRSVVRAAAMIPTQPDPGAIIGRRGGLCGDPGIRGEAIAPISARVQGCGIEEPVRVTEVDGVRLSTPATIDCTTARALRSWVSETVRPAVGRLGGGVQSLQVYGHYACRPRNNQKGAKISEHGRGRAIDVGAINLANGASITVLDGWRHNEHGQILRALHRGACGRFGTVLGPEADRFHQNHLHLDTARHRSGSFCR
jgi:hypothetical protein